MNEVRVSYPTGVGRTSARRAAVRRRRLLLGACGIGLVLLLVYLTDHYRGSTTLALAAYNGGLTNVDRWVASAHAQGRPLTKHEIPFPETRAYVLKVLWAQRQYRSSYSTQLGYG